MPLLLAFYDEAFAFLRNTNPSMIKDGLASPEELFLGRVMPFYRGWQVAAITYLRHAVHNFWSGGYYCKNTASLLG